MNLLCNRKLSCFMKKSRFWTTSLCCLLETFVAIFHSLSHVPTMQPHGNAAHQASLSPGVCSNSHQLSWWCNPTISSSVTRFSSCKCQSLFQWLGILHPVAKVFKLQHQQQSFQYSFRVDFFRIEWFDLLAIHGTLKSLLQHQSLKASILSHSAFFMVQFSHTYMTTYKIIVWLYRPLLAKWCFCFLTCCLGLS